MTESRPVLDESGGRPPRRRPRGAIRQALSLAAPDNLAAYRLVAAERLGQRGQRLLTTLAGGRERIRPRRSKMRALRLAPGGRLRWQSVPAPAAPGPLGAVVHPVAISTCDMDCPLYMGHAPFVMPLHLGHECVADVVAVGEKVEGVAVGDRVLVPFQINCGTCPSCRAGHTGNCTSVPISSCYGFGLATGHWGGAYSDLMAVPYADAMLVPLPPGVDPVAAASVADNICDAYRHVAPHLPAILERDPDARVTVLAATSRRSHYSSSIPLYAGVFARALGAKEVWLADNRPHIRRHAERLGLHPVKPRDLRRAPPAPLVVDVSVSARGLGLAVSSTAPDGICTSTGNLHASSRIPSTLMYLRSITLIAGQPHVRAIMPDVLAGMASGKLRPEVVTTGVGNLDEAPALLAEHYTSQGVKAVLVAS